MISKPPPLDAAKTSSNDSIEELKYAVRYRVLAFPWQIVFLLLTILVCFLATNQIFNLGFFVGHILMDVRYLFLYVGLILVMTFILFPINSRTANKKMPWYDIVLMLITLGIFGYFAWVGADVVREGWDFAAPNHAIYLALIAWLIVLEAGRRAGGWPILVTTGIISLYPLFADRLPEVIAGASMDLFQAASFHLFSEESVFGVPTQVGALLVFGFLLFGVALQYTGAGKFFINLAFALLGHTRGGPAKVAIFSSGLMGSMSGGPVINVLTTGPLTIPAMVRVGYTRTYAAGVESCASTGGVLMPPIMGATAFIMANFLGVSYTAVIIAALVPSLLYFYGLFMQIDAYAARHNMAGLPREELPKVWQVLKEGWYYVAVFAFLIWMLVYLQREATAPFYATIALLVINQFTRNRLDAHGFIEYLKGIGRILAELGGLLAAVGLIIGALQVTGMAGTLTNDLIYLADGYVLLLLVMGALTSFILGMGLTVTAAYIMLAIVLAPALINAGIDPIAAHMFIMYWGMLSFITPPVAIAAFVAASVAKCSPMQTAFQSMRLGAVIYFIPFFFVFNTGLLLQGSWPDIALAISLALIGIGLLSYGLQGYLIGVGHFGLGPLAWVASSLLVLGGLLLAAPSAMLSLNFSTHMGLALALVATGIIIGKFGPQSRIQSRKA